MDRYEEESFVSDDATLAENDGDRFEAASKVQSSPAVRKLGKEHNIDLSTVKGSGPNGRVLKSDVLKIIHQSDVIGSVDQSMSTTSSKPSFTPTASITPDPTTEEDEIIPIRGYHRLMVKSMTSSLSVPHMVYTDEINVTYLNQLRSTLKPLSAQKGIKLTLLPFFLKAASLALHQFPTINGSIDIAKRELRVHKRHDLGVAVDTSKGLVVVVVRGCERRSVEEIAGELGRLFALAAEGNLTEEDISNPTFTLSNIGAIGGTYMSPVVLPPQVAIGAMGKIQRLPRFIDDSSMDVEAVQIMPISWGGDHRAIDGATLARFSNAWKYYVENPQAMMFEMR
jgi:2-oxoisovalerate dehydrogenase E2 component (dihydrolipoyl transacylase)